MKKPSSKTIALIQKNLLNWFQKNQRPLPWRLNYAPYEVWISEIMLQQTQVKTVLPYFDRWMKKFPTIQHVADASEDEILKLWEGLGYYSRARNLQKAAKMIIEKYGGQFPSAYDEILSLPGIGPYTAGAISSIAFNHNEALVDGNVIRVLSRLFDYEGNTRLPKAEKWMWEKAEALLPKGQARYFNQGLMELGALVCSPAGPSCQKCPLQPVCQSNKNQTTHLRPDRGPKRKTESIAVAIAVIWKDGKILIQKRPSSGLMGGLWEFPGGKVEPGEHPEEALLREVAEETNLKIKNIRFFQKIKHTYTQFKVELFCYQADWSMGKLKRLTAMDSKWVSPAQLKDFAFPVANGRIVNDIMKGY